MPTTKRSSRTVTHAGIAMYKALIAMSGGVDSSVAAYLMKTHGFDCIGCTMKLYQNEDAGVPPGHTCCSLDDIEDARAVAFRLGMPYHVFNFSEDFREKVMDKFVQSYEAGLTPNPCIDCNRFMKFDKLFGRAKAKTRYRQQEQPAKVTVLDGGSLMLEFDEPQRALTPGQAVVLYDGDTVVGGGVIQKTQ